MCMKCGDEHKTNECRSEKNKCVDCEMANKKFNPNINIEHHVYEKNCIVYNAIVL